MKTIKYLLLGALVVGISAPLMAQDNKSTIDAISKVIKANPAGAKDLLPDGISRLSISIRKTQKDTLNMQISTVDVVRKRQ